jgi:protein phosphatase
MNIHFFAKSDIGRVRAANEDFFLNEKISDNEYLFVVADGMGGHQAGDIASKLASESFLDHYRALRKKGVAVSSAIDQSVRRANLVVFRKAAADVEKRGMGTTFSAVIIAGMKAFIAHVGDSRVYLVRNSRIKRLTTDHSFVEKLVEEGRISPDEARDHPQKNVLYMSLGARESFTPEIVNDIILEDGDALLMCSDGLSNMVDDGTLMNVAMGGYPQEAAEELVRLANDHGGADNITVQVIRLGTLETLEKTKPIRVARPRRRVAKGTAALLLFALLAVLAYRLFLAPEAGSGDIAGAMAVPAPPAARAWTPRLGEIGSARLNGLGVTAADCRFLSGRKLYAVRDNRLAVFDLDSAGLLSIGLEPGEQVVPSRGAGVFLLRREATRDPGYALLRQGDERPLLLIRHDGQVNSRENRPGAGSLYRIAGLRGDVTADYIDDDLFLFHDQERYYGIREWRKPEGLPAVIGGLAVVAGGRLAFQAQDGGMVMMHHDPAAGRAALYRITGGVEKLGEFSLPAQPQPLLLEYAGAGALVAFYADGLAKWSGGRRQASGLYTIGNFQLRAAKVMTDLADGRKLVVDDGNQLFSLACEP